MSENENSLICDNKTSIYHCELKSFIFDLEIPERIYLKSAMEFDARG